MEIRIGNNIIVIPEIHESKLIEVLEWILIEHKIDYTIIQENNYKDNPHQGETHLKGMFENNK